ncbi:MAG: methylated-DNA--[protein]-cysteine S-methyltransferase [Candidatus Tyrphobacter sp.]
MRCRDIEALWDEVHGGCARALRTELRTHLRACPDCRQCYEECESVALCLSCLSYPEPSYDLTRRVLEHVAMLRDRLRSDPVVLGSARAPVGRLYIGLRGQRVVYLGFDTGGGFEAVRHRVEERLRRPVVRGELPRWLHDTLDRFFATWRIDDEIVDISDLTPFEQAALRAAATIPPGEVRSYAWVAAQIGRPNAARAVGRVMARNPLALFFPCHRVVDSSGALHNYYYGLEMKRRLLEMEGYRPA